MKFRERHTRWLVLILGTLLSAKVGNKLSRGTGTVIQRWFCKRSLCFFPQPSLLSLRRHLLCLLAGPSKCAGLPCAMQNHDATFFRRKRNGYDECFAKQRSTALHFSEKDDGTGNSSHDGEAAGKAVTVCSTSESSWSGRSGTRDGCNTACGCLRLAV